jgi:hypothetical protein
MVIKRWEEWWGLTLRAGRFPSDHTTKRALIVPLKQCIRPILMPPLQDKILHAVKKVPIWSVHEPIA